MQPQPKRRRQTVQPPVRRPSVTIRPLITIWVQRVTPNRAVTDRLAAVGAYLAYLLCGSGPFANGTHHSPPPVHVPWGSTSNGRTVAPILDPTNRSARPRFYRSPVLDAALGVPQHDLEGSSTVPPVAPSLDWPFACRTELLNGQTVWPLHRGTVLLSPPVVGRTWHHWS